ncbi:hypothetical protein BJP34_35705 (plasmid) [Moorena producens PAL-8-15-08-1]|uniref:Uncharacterized protein n=1 Tax=Moorena producens PAL-8-15-08-1 TaxID=1458985 RepID=A0A1D8U489_9CYAN|nr:hypothetical protein [Moorena producens]AOX04727.1 hypothetical protein BJP34_35705 [Moorena producens PAL-8-15-08-1]
MEWVSNLIGFGIAGTAAVLVAVSPSQVSVEPVPDSITPVTQIQPTAPKRHRINVTVTAPEDIKVKQWDRVKVGQTLSDRTAQRKTLEARRNQLQIAINQMSLPLPPIQEPPTPSFSEEEAAIAKARNDLALVEREIQSAPPLRFKMDYLNVIHDQDKIQRRQRLEEKRIKTQIAIDSAIARLNAAKTRYQQQIYRHSLEMMTYQTSLQRQQYQLASLVKQSQEVEKELAELSIVRSPYSGRVRRVKIVSQTDRVITAEITLDVRGDR